MLHWISLFHLVLLLYHTIQEADAILTIDTILRTADVAHILGEFYSLVYSFYKFQLLHLLCICCFQSLPFPLLWKPSAIFLMFIV